MYSEGCILVVLCINYAKIAIERRKNGVRSCLYSRVLFKMSFAQFSAISTPFCYQKVMFSDFNFHTIYMGFFAWFRNVLSLGASPSAIQDRVNRIVGQSVVGFALCFFFFTTNSVIYITE